jgi:hypothetical protein
MMRRALRLLTLVLLAHAAPASAAQDIVEGPTEREAREARDVAAAFMSRMKETRDVATLKHMYVDDFVRRRLEIEQNVQTDFGSSLSYRELEAEADLREWERLYAAKVNLRYFMVLYFIADSHKFLTHEPTLSELCPPEVVALLDANPFLAEKSPVKKYKIETLEELRGVIATLERAAGGGRDLSREHPRLGRQATTGGSLRPNRRLARLPRRHALFSPAHDARVFRFDAGESRRRDEDRLGDSLSLQLEAASCVHRALISCRRGDGIVNAFAGRMA